MPKLKFEDYRAPWETEAGGETEIDKPKLKRYLFNLIQDKEKAQEREAEVTTERDALKKAADEKAREGESEVDRLKRENQELKAAAEKPKGPTVEELKYRVALEKGLTAKQAKRLQGTTEEELSADADDLLESWGGKSTPPDGDGDDDGDDQGVTPARQPRQLRNPASGDGDSGKEIDIDKALAQIPRVNSF